MEGHYENTEIDVEVVEDGVELLSVFSTCQLVPHWPIGPDTLLGLLVSLCTLSDEK